ncbi:MAG: TRAP transporter small permease [Chloroflexota bacterium]|nr:TRAP transporter small permease [Chloroflexota bacterium]
MFKNMSLYLNKWAGATSFIILLSIMVIVLIDIVCRALWRQTLWGFELSGLLLASAIGLGMGYAQLGDHHIKIEIVHSRLPLKVRNIVDLIKLTLCFLVSLVISWQLWNLTLRSIREKIVTMAVDTPIWLFQGLMFIGFVLLSLQLLVDIRYCARQIQSKEGGI